MFSLLIYFSSYARHSSNKYELLFWRIYIRFEIMNYAFQMFRGVHLQIIPAIYLVFTDLFYNSDGHFRENCKKILLQPQFAPNSHISISSVWENLKTVHCMILPVPGVRRFSIHNDVHNCIISYVVIGMKITNVIASEWRC